MLYYRELKDNIKNKISKILKPLTKFGKYSKLVVKINN
jgi:hypothetical protein